MSFLEKYSLTMFIMGAIVFFQNDTSLETWGGKILLAFTVISQAIFIYFPKREEK